MRITFKNDILTKSGKCKMTGETVFKSRKNDTICIQRRFTYPRLTEHHKQIGQKFKAAVEIWKVVSDPFKKDLPEYTRLYNMQHLPKKKYFVSGYNIFISALCKHYAPFDDVSDVRNTYGARLSAWILTGVLPAVKTEYRFNATL